MLHELLAAYLERVERTIRKCRQVYAEHYVEEVLTPERINLPDGVLPATKPDIAEAIGEAGEIEL